MNLGDDLANLDEVAIKKGGRPASGMVRMYSLNSMSAEVEPSSCKYTADISFPLT